MEYLIRNQWDYIDFRNFLDNQVEKMKDNFKPFTIEKKLVKDPVSRKQHGYLFGIVYPTLKAGMIEQGREDIRRIDNEDFDVLCRTAFYFKLIETDKGVVKLPKRLCLGKAYWEEVKTYIDDLIHFAAEIGIYIPAPHEDIFQTL